ncbi:MAG: hypothetical protein K8S99_16280 [Planctomycetes bacterium]|nr:hypothetical protein [Planctomycetota bacterium]
MTGDPATAVPAGSNIAPAPHAPLPPTVVTSAPAPAAPPPLSSSTPADPWAALLASIADKPQAAWVRSFTLRSLNEGVAHLAVRPGNRDMVSYATQRREDLAQMLGRIVGRPVRVEIDAAVSAPPVSRDIDAPGGDADDAPASTGPANSNPALPSDRGRRMQDAMALPLVREVMNLFDATIVEVRSAAEPAPATPAPTPPTSADAPPMSDPDLDPEP